MSIMIKIITTDKIFSRTVDHDNTSEEIIDAIHEVVNKAGIDTIDDIQIQKTKHSNTLQRIRATCIKAIKIVKEYK